MINYSRKILAVLLHILIVANANSQQLFPFQDEIINFKKQDSLNYPPKSAILFAGSSSFRLWTDVQASFPGYTITNRGFGGSTLIDVIHSVNDIIIPYHPKQIVLYCGENDLAASDSVTPRVVLQRFKQLFTLIRSAIPNIPLVYVSIKPSPSRQALMPKMEKSNKLIRKYLKMFQHTAFADVYYKMLDQNGIPIKELFKEDNLHMNSQGYAIWQKVLKPYLLK